MSRIKAICSGHNPLLAELFQAELDLAKACEEGGADAVVIPLVGEYSANLEYEASMIRDLISVLGLPVGAYIGSSIKELEWEMALDIGIDFIAAFPSNLPPFAAFDGRIDKLIYVPSGLSVEVYRSLSSVEGVVSLVYVPTSQMKEDMPFNMLDVINLGIISRFSFKPVILKVAHDVRPKDVPLLLKWGCSGLMVNPSIGGSGPETYKEIISKYKEALRGGPGYFKLPSYG